MASVITAIRYHDFSMGHRVCGHEGACRGMHGHNYRVHFHCEAPSLDEIGRVVDFSIIKDRLCQWLEENWDHQFLMWEDDPLFALIGEKMRSGVESGERATVTGEMMTSIWGVPFNPTAEQMAIYLLEVIGPKQLDGYDVRLVKVIVEETRKCSAVAEFK